MIFYIKIWFFIKVINLCYKTIFSILVERVNVFNKWVCNFLLWCYKKDFIYIDKCKNDLREDKFVLIVDEYGKEAVILYRKELKTLYSNCVFFKLKGV